MQMDNRPLPIPIQKPGFRVSMLGHKLKVAMDAVGLVILWDTDRMVTVEATAQLWNRTAGLCGTLDQDVTNEFRSKDGSHLKVSTKYHEKTKYFYVTTFQFVDVSHLCRFMGGAICRS